MCRGSNSVNSLLPWREWVFNGVVNLVWVINPEFQKLKMAHTDEYTLELKLVNTRPTMSDLNSALLSEIGFVSLSSPPNWPYTEHFGPDKFWSTMTLKFPFPLSWSNFYKTTVGCFVYVRVPQNVVKKGEAVKRFV